MKAEKDLNSQQEHLAAIDYDLRITNLARFIHKKIRNEKLEIRNGKSSIISHLSSHIQIIAIEQSKESIPYTKVNYTFPVALVVGNETFGVTEETLQAVDEIVEIPMWGINKSLNVIVSAAIVAYHCMANQKTS